jgi:hypothetical protein
MLVAPLQIDGAGPIRVLGLHDLEVRRNGQPGNSGKNSLRNSCARRRLHRSVAGGAMVQSIQNETRLAVEAMEVSNREVDAGIERTAMSGKAVAQIIEMADHVSGMTSQIATAASRQSGVMTTVNTNVSQISGLTRSLRERRSRRPKHVQTYPTWPPTCSDWCSCSKYKRRTTAGDTDPRRRALVTRACRPAPVDKTNHRMPSRESAILAAL